MPVKIIDGDLFETKANYICHQVNCQGRMGSGVAKQIRSKYPEAYDAYIEKCKTTGVLGQTQFVKCKNGKTVVNMFAQDRYGYDGERYTDYAAFMSCLMAIRIVVPENEVVAMPYKIGCGLGGGEWGVVLRMIKEELPNHTVELWKKEV